MVSPIRTLRGKVHGKFIELDRDPGLPEGEDITIHIQRKIETDATHAGLRKSAGAWAEDAPSLDVFIEEIYRARSDQRTDVDE